MAPRPEPYLANLVLVRDAAGNCFARYEYPDFDQALRAGAHWAMERFRVEVVRVPADIAEVGASGGVTPGSGPHLEGRVA